MPMTKSFGILEIKGKKREKRKKKGKKLPLLSTIFTGRDSGNVGGINIDIKDKNIFLCGIKVGMKKNRRH